MINTPAETVVNNNVNSNNTNNTVQREAPKVIAPLAIPGTVPRGNNSSPVEEELPIEDVVEEETTATVTGKSNEPESEEEVEEEAPQRLNSEIEIEFNGKNYKFKNAKEIEAFVKKQTIAARGAQSKADIEKKELERRLKALEEGLGGTKTTGNQNKENVEFKAPEYDAETTEFWQDVMKGYAQLDGVKDPSERARQQTILAASAAQVLIQQAEERLLVRLSKLEEKITPFEQEKQQSAEQKTVLTKANQAFTAVAEMTDDDGSTVYPELAQPQDLGVIANMWKVFKDEGTPEKLLYHPDFIMMLIHTYRDTKSTDPNTQVEGKKPAVIAKKKAPSTQLPPNITKGITGFPGMTIPGVMGRH